MFKLNVIIIIIMCFVCHTICNDDDFEGLVQFFHLFTSQEISVVLNSNTGTSTSLLYIIAMVIQD